MTVSVENPPSHSAVVLPNIPGYIAQDQIYAGPRTLVYQAVSEKTQRPVVIKLLRQAYSSIDGLTQFRNQYAIGKKLTNPGVIQLYELAFYQDRLMIVMEDFGGISLAQYLQRLKQQSEGNFPTIDVSLFLFIAVQISDVLAY
ncbi:protein kinase, partial [cf. Phormidesmis sp. LEGE 11477]|uniref:protein kinase domain-containing protein n=1 Tax=cf. Phormidesmis sp. LEGE 11477 TaxID=1828680 RepID=UPI00187E401F